MKPDHFIVKLTYDPDADVWYVEESNVIGLIGEAKSFEELLRKLPALISDMVAENYTDRSFLNLPVEVIGSTSIRISEAA